MENKILFFDIDGTLAMRGKIPPSNIEALKLLKEKGYFTFICTGRAPFYAQGLFQDLVSGIISCNGRYIIYEGKKLHGEQLSEDELTYYQEQFKTIDCGALLISDHKSYAFHLNDQQIEGLKNNYGANRIDIYDPKQPYYAFDLFYTSPEHYQLITTTFQDTLVINDHGGLGHCDCSTINYDKGSAIAHLLAHFNIPIEHSYAFGDGYNDQAMFREVAHKIAMGNAVDVLKEKATYITDTIDNDGIMKALQHLELI